MRSQVLRVQKYGMLLTSHSAMQHRLHATPGRARAHGRCKKADCRAHHWQSQQTKGCCLFVACMQCALHAQTLHVWRHSRWQCAAVACRTFNLPVMPVAPEDLAGCCRTHHRSPRQPPPTAARAPACSESDKSMCVYMCKLRHNFYTSATAGFNRVSLECLLHTRNTEVHFKSMLSAAAAGWTLSNRSAKRASELTMKCQMMRLDGVSFLPLHLNLRSRHSSQLAGYGLPCRPSNQVLYIWCHDGWPALPYSGFVRFYRALLSAASPFLGLAMPFHNILLASQPASSTHLGSIHPNSFLCTFFLKAAKRPTGVEAFLNAVILLILAWPLARPSLALPSGLSSSSAATFVYLEN